MSSYLSVTCPECGTVREARPECAGRTGICPGCKKPLRIPVSSPRVIETTAAPRVVGSGRARVDPEFRKQVIGIAGLLIVLAFFGRDWLRPQPVGNHTGADRTGNAPGTPLPSIIASGAVPSGAGGIQEKLPLHGTTASRASTVAALDSRLPPVQPVVGRRPMPFDCPQAVGVRSAVFLPDNVHAMTVHATDRGNLLRKWVIDTGTAVGQPVVLPNGRDFHLRFSPNGSRLALTISQCEQGVMLLNARTGVTIRTKVTNHLSPLSVPVWNGDGTLIYGSPLGTVETWDIVGDSNTSSLSQGQPVTAVAVSDAGYLLSGDATGEIRLWSLADNGRYAASYQKFRAPVRLLETRIAGNDALVLAAAGEQGKAWECHVFDLASQQTLHSIALPEDVTALAVTSDWRRLATGHREGQVALWDLLTGDELQTTPVHNSEVTTLAIAADNSCMMSGCYQSRNDVTVRLRPLPPPVVRESVSTEAQKHADTEQNPSVPQVMP